MAEKVKVIENRSKGYGYNYASLSDIAHQGVEIPKMKTGTENGKEYVFWHDAELNEWIRGAEIVLFEHGKGMNDAQAYGSSLSYARRYTTLMAHGIATDDDVNVEKEVVFDIPSEEQVKSLAEEFRNHYTIEEQAIILNGLKLTKAEDIKFDDLQKYVNFKKYGKK